MSDIESEIDRVAYCLYQRIWWAIRVNHFEWNSDNANALIVP